jgi:type IV secretory pathway TraG/TraD family ATPase VirD4
MGNSHPPEKPEMSQEQFNKTLLLIGLALACLAFSKIYSFYLRNFEEIYLMLYAVAAACFALGAYRYTQSTQDLAHRVNKLKPFWKPDAGLFVGNTLDGTDLYLPEKIRTGHVHIPGSTGRGKTLSVIEPWIIRDLIRGRSTILIDGKGDPEIAEHIRIAIARAGSNARVVVFDLGNPLNSCTTNPLAMGSAQQITDRLFAAFDFEDPFYKGVQLDAAGSVVRLIQEVDAKDHSPGVVSMRRLYELLTVDDTLTEAVGRCKDSRLQAKLMRYLSLPKKERDGLLMGLTSQLGPFAEGEVECLVNGKVEGREFEILSDLLLKPQDRPTAFILLIPTLKYQQIGHQLGKLLIQELGWAVGERASRSSAHSPFIGVFLDEFSAFVYKGFENILNKARSSQVAFHLSHQSNADLAKVDVHLAEIINTNTNVKCILGVNDPGTADFFARHLGTTRTEKQTERAKRNFSFAGFTLFGKEERTGDLSIREVDEFRIDPNDLKEAIDGRGVLHFPSSRGSITEKMQFQFITNDELIQAKRRNEHEKDDAPHTS